VTVGKRIGPIFFVRKELLMSFFSSRRNGRLKVVAANKRMALRAACRTCIERLEERTLLSVAFQGAISAGAPAGTNAVASVDFNGDGRADLVSMPASGQVNVLLGNGDNSFGAPIVLATPDNALTANIADINGDGLADVLVTYSVANPSGTTTGLSVFINNGDGTFQPAVNTDLGTTFVSLQTGDFNGDGKTVLFVVGSGTTVFTNTTLDNVYLGNGDGTFGALDAFGNIAVSYRGKVHFTDSVSAGLPSDYTFSATDNGVHTFTVTLSTAALQTLKLTDTANSQLFGTVSITASSPTTGGGTTGGGSGGGGGH
jgi:hypothetical protein